MDGLIIKPEWLVQIYGAVSPFSKPKTLEIRGHATKKRGRIYLLESGTGMITGETTIVDCIQIKDESEWDARRDDHQVLDINHQGKTIKGYDYIAMRYGNGIYAWVLKDTVKYDKPKAYVKPKGAIIWVKNVEHRMQADGILRKAELFDNFVRHCEYFNGETDVNNGYGCNHPNQEEKCANEGCCYCFSCPIGYPAEEESLTEDDIEWVDGKPEADDIDEDGYIITGGNAEITDSVRRQAANKKA